MWSSRSYDRIMKMKARELRREREEFAALTELVLDAVHPDNLGALPPSPETIRHKGWLLGLI